jgi:hypothetical protein
MANPDSISNWPTDLVGASLWIALALLLHQAGLPRQRAIKVLQGCIAGEVQLVLAAVHLDDGLALFGTAKHNPAAASSAGTASGLSGLHR